MSGRIATQPRRQARPSRSAAGKSKQLSDEDQEDIVVEDDEEEDIDDEEERELLPPDPDHVAVRFTVGDTFEEDSIVTVTPEDSDSVPLAVTFQTKVLRCNTERSVVTLQYQVKDRQLYDAYANTVLRPGATLLSNDGTKCAQVVELDAEWHRGQPWAKNSEHLGKSVRWHVQGLGMRDGVVWGWLPREESDFTDDSGQAAPLWRIRFDPSKQAMAVPADLEEFELQKALEMFRTKDARGAEGKDSGRKRSREAVAQEPAHAAGDRTLGAAGAASARSDKASAGSGTRQDVMVSKEPEREREGERQREREGDKEADKEREKLRLREKASEMEAWVASVVEAMGKNNASTVAAKVLPRLALLKDLKVAQDKSKAADTIQGLNDIAQRSPGVFAIKSVVDECLLLLAWSAGPSPRDGIVQHQLAASVLLAGHKDQDVWPAALVKAYLDDAMQMRRWVDIPQAAVLVANIVTAFPGVRPGQARGGGPGAEKDRESKSVLSGKEPEHKRRKMGGAGLERGGHGAESSGGQRDVGKDSGNAEGDEVRARFRDSALQREVQGIVLESVKRHLNTQPAGDSLQSQRKMHNVLRALAYLMGYEAVRHETMKRLDSWLSNPNLVRHLKELMPRLASQCTLSTDLESDTLRMMLRIRPKPNVTQVYNEALGTLCRCNRGFPLRAFFVLLEIEMKDYDSFLHASNKALKNSQYIGTILKSAGVPHLIADRPPELGGSFQRFNVMDMGLGKLDYEIQGSLRRWSTVMLDSTEARGGAMVSASGVILVALEEEVFAGDNCGNSQDSQQARLRSAAVRAQDAGAAGLVVVLTSNGQWAASPRSWDESSVSIPVLGTMPGDDSLSLLEAVSGKFSVAGKAGSVTTGALSRVPREILLAKSIQVFADSPDKRAGMALLLRKVLKTCQIGGVPELDLVAFAVATMTPGDNFDVLDRDSKVLWACALVDVCVYVCIHLASQVIDAGQASVHADRGGGGLETRSQRAAVRVRAQVMRIVDEILVSWVPAVLRPHVPVDKLNQALRRMMFYEDAATYSVEPLLLETHEKQAVKLLQAEMGMTQASLLALARLGQRDSAGFRAIEPMMALELVEVLVRRALPVAARRHSEVLPSDAAPNSAKAIGRDAEVLRISETHVCLWEVLVELARSCGSGDDGGHPDLAPATRVWQAYLNITVLAVLNPKTLGLLVWTRLPTIRSMMQMLITGNFTFPPLASDSEALAGDADAARQDMAAAEEQQAKRALKRLHVPKWLETATLLLPSGPARRPPKETLAMLRMLDTQCDLGQLLRQSSEPNMLLETISAPGQDSSSCVGWLGAVLKRYPATASALPVVTVCELLLANLGAAPTSFIAPLIVRVHRKEQSTMYGLATRLAQCIHSKNEWDGMLFFLQMIGHHNEQKRRLAVVALELLLVCLDDLRKMESEKEVPGAANAHGGAEDVMGGNDQGAESGEEEELLAGGGDSTVVEEEELLSGGGTVDGELQEEGAKMGAEGDSGENTLDKIAEGNGRVQWLQRLISMENIPGKVRETLGLQLRCALKTETEVQLLLDYLQYLSHDNSSSVTAVARDVAYLVVRRRVLVQHLSKLPGAITVLSRIFLAGLSSRESHTTAGDSSMNSADKNGDDDELVKVPGSTHSTARIVLRAGLQTLGLSGVEAHATAEDMHGQRAQLMQLVAPSKEAVATLGLSDDEITLMLQADDAHVMACAVAAASLPQLIAALRLCGAAPVCLAAVVTRLKGMGDVVSPLAAALPSRMGARAVSALALKYPQEAAWLSAKLGLKLGAPKKLVPPDLSKMLPPAITESWQMEIDVAAAVKSDAAAAVSADCPSLSSCSDGPLVQVSAAVGLSALVAAEAPRGGWKAVVRGLMERGGPTNEKGLQMDLMATVNPLMWKDADAKVYERVFALHPATGADSGHGNGGIGRSDSGRVPSSCAALLGPMLRLGGVAGGMCLEKCRQWLLSSVLIDCETGDMRVKTATHGDVLQNMGTVLDCSLCLEVLSACITGESGPVEGVWGEGGGGEVSETKTRRENLGLGSRVLGETGGGGGTTEECVTLAHYIVSEGCKFGGRMGMGRMHMMVVLLNDDQQKALAVSRVLLSLAALRSGSSAGGAEVDVKKRMALAAELCHHRLRKALPLLMTHNSVAVVAPTSPLDGRHDGEGAGVWAESLAEGDSHEEGEKPIFSQQTARLDRLFHNTITALQDDEKEAAAIHVARQLARAQPALVANRMLLLRGMCAGKALLRLSEFVERGGPRLLSHVLDILEAAAPHSLRSRSLPLVLDEILLLFASIVRYESALARVLARLAALLVRVVQQGGWAKAYVGGHAPLLRKLAVWYFDIADLDRILELLHPLAGSESGADREALEEVDTEAGRVEFLAARLRFGRLLGGGLGVDTWATARQPVAQGDVCEASEGADRLGAQAQEKEGWGAGQDGLLAALEECEALTGEDVGERLRERRLVRLHAPLLALIADTRSARARESAYKLLFRAAVSNASAAESFADKHAECLDSAHAAVQGAAIAQAKDMALAHARAVPRLLRCLLQLARRSDAAAKTELLRITSSCLDFHCMPSK